MCKFIIACLISLSALSFSSCTQKKVATSVAYMDFPQTIELKARVQPLDTALFRYPFRVRVQGDKAVVMDLHGTDYFCHVFHYPGFRYFASFGKRGEAPEEMLSAENIRWHGQSLWGLDAGKSVLTKYDFTSSGCSIVPQKMINMDADMLRVLDFVMVDDFTFIVPDGSGSSRFCWVNYQGKLLRRTGQIPSANAEALQNARPALAQAWRSFIDYNPRNGVLAAVTQLGEVLEVFNLKDSTHVVRIGPHGEPEFKISQGYGIPTGIMGFSDVQVADSAIYAVFHGRSFKEIAQNVQQGVYLPDGGRYIYVFSLTGEPLCRYVLDHYVYGISVDEQKGIILATDVNKDDPIIEYSMK